MRFYRSAILAAATAIVLTPTVTFASGYYPPIYQPPVRPPVVSKPPPAGNGGGGGNWHLCPTPAGIFICAVAVGIVVHEVLGPACASKTKYNVAHGYDHPTLWRPLCRRAGPKPIAARG